MSAVRLARGHTGRDLLIKFEGCYHGHVDSLMVNSGSGLATFGIASSPGIPKDTVASTLVAPLDDIDAVEYLFSEHGGEIAENLFRLYEYARQQVIAEAKTNEASGTLVAIASLEDIREAWAEIRTIL